MNHVGWNMLRTIYAIMLGLLISSPSFAQSARTFLKEMQGSYSAKGTAEILEGKPEKISCKLESAFSEEKSTLQIRGNCVSVRGKGRINGSIRLDGDKLSGGFTSAHNKVKITKSSGKYTGSKITLASVVLDERNGKISKVQQVIKRSGRGFSTLFYLFDKKTQKYRENGLLTFKRK